MTRVTRRSRFAAIPNDAMRDERLSIEARGLLALMMGMGDRWVFRSKDLMKRSCSGKEKYQRMVRELKDAGYLEVQPRQVEGGKLGGHDYVLVDEPASRETRPAVETVGGKPGHIRTPTSKNTNNKTSTPKGADLFSEESEPTEQQKMDQEIETLIENGFNKFWNDIWPSHQRKAGKADCKKVYEQACRGKHPKADKIFPADLNAATERFIASVTDRQYLPGPLPWLRKPGWEPFIGSGPQPGKPKSYAQRLLSGEAR